MPGPVEPEEPDELERLRRRAYGRDADITGDPAAQARLAELEAARHRERAPGVDAAAAVPAPAPERGPLPEPAEEPPSADGIDGAPVARRRRRRLAILGVAIAAVFVNAILITVMWPHPPNYGLAPDYILGQKFITPPDFVLQLVSDGADVDEPEDPHGTLNRLGLDSEEMRRFENFGYLSVWSGESRYGTTCVLVAHPVQGLNEGIHAEACSPGGQVTIADLTQSPPESLTRFVLRESRVDVYVYDRATDPIAPEG